MDDVWRSHPEILQILSERVRPTDLLPYLNTINDRDREKIEVRERMEGPKDAVFILHDSLKRRGKNGFKNLLQALREVRQQDVVDEIEACCKIVTKKSTAGQIDSTIASIETVYTRLQEKDLTIVPAKSNSERLIDSTPSNSQQIEPSQLARAGTEHDERSLCENSIGTESLQSRPEEATVDRSVQITGSVTSVPVSNNMNTPNVAPNDNTARNPSKLQAEYVFSNEGNQAAAVLNDHDDKEVSYDDKKCDVGNDESVTVSNIAPDRNRAGNPIQMAHLKLGFQYDSVADSSRTNRKQPIVPSVNTEAPDKNRRKGTDSDSPQRISDVVDSMDDHSLETTLVSSSQQQQGRIPEQNTLPEQEAMTLPGICSKAENADHYGDVGVVRNLQSIEQRPEPSECSIGNTINNSEVVGRDSVLSKKENYTTQVCVAEVVEDRFVFSSAADSSVKLKDRNTGAGNDVLNKDQSCEEVNHIPAQEENSEGQSSVVETCKKAQVKNTEEHGESSAKLFLSYAVVGISVALMVYWYYKRK